MLAWMMTTVYTESTHTHTHTLCRSYAQYVGLAVCFCQPLLYEHAVIACAQYTETFMCSILFTSVLTHHTYTACTCTIGIVLFVYSAIGRWNMLNVLAEIQTGWRQAHMQHVIYSFSTEKYKQIGRYKSVLKISGKVLSLQSFAHTKYPYCCKKPIYRSLDRSCH
jgi:hypothetical protein